jgi:hypothetical protein
MQLPSESHLLVPSIRSSIRQYRRNSPGDNLGMFFFQGHAMGDCFKPWQRKTGVVALVMSWALMGIWIRLPPNRYESVTLFSRLRFFSAVGWLELEFAHEKFPQLPGVQFGPMNYQSGLLQHVWGLQWTPWGAKMYQKVDWRFYPLRIIKARTWHSHCLAMPYASIVVVLTLLSAVLLFWPVRRTGQRSRTADSRVKGMAID